MTLERSLLRPWIFILLILSLQLPVAGGDARTEDYREIIKIGGTGGAYGVMAQVSAAFQKKNPHMHIAFSPSLGSTGGIKAVLAGALDLGLSSRPLTAEELQQGAVAVEYGRTPLILVTSYRGAAINFTLEQIASLYSGKIKNYPDDTPIRLILRPRGDSDTSFLSGLSPEIAAAVLKAQTREGMIVASTDQDNANALERIKGAIGWMTLAQLISEKRSLTPLAIENIMPSLETFSSGVYPYNKPFSVVIRPNPTKVVKSFLEFLTSAAGRKILFNNGILVDQEKL
jgi:phosphate transport system substrate-binding protein